MDVKDLPEVGSFLRSSDLATLMCVWFMWRMEKRLDRMTIILTMLADRNRLNPMIGEESSNA
jgi:hypothetical protein